MRDRFHARVPAAVALATLVVIAGGATAALAAPALKGATYTGKIRLAHKSNVTYQISFKVSAKGKRVRNFSLPNGYPVYCQGGGFSPGAGRVERDHQEGKVHGELAESTSLPLTSIRGS